MEKARLVDCRLQLVYSPAAWEAEHIAKLGEALLEIVSVAAGNPGVALGDVPLAALVRPAGLSGQPLAALEFNF